MQIGLVQHHDTGMFHRHFINERMIGIVAQLVDDGVVEGGVELRGPLAERFHAGEALQMIQQDGGVIRDTAFGWRQRRKERDPLHRMSSTVNEPSASGMRASRGVRAGSLAKKISTVRLVAGPLMEATMRSASAV